MNNEDQRLLLSFEYGVHLALAAAELKVDIDKPMMVRAEKVILGEFKNENNTNERLAKEMGPNILAIFEPKG